MNKENILKVADAIEHHSIPWLGFNMASFCMTAGGMNPDRSGHGCGTVACIAGWGAAVSGTPKETLLGDFDADDVAKEFMALSNDQCNDLFYAKSHPKFSRGGLWTYIPQDQAIRTLRHLAETGEVDWTV